MNRSFAFLDRFHNLSQTSRTLCRAEQLLPASHSSAVFPQQDCLHEDNMCDSPPLDHSVLSSSSALLAQELARMLALVLAEMLEELVGMVLVLVLVVDEGKVC